MNPVELIQLHKDTFTKSEIKIMDYMLDHLDQIASYPLVDFAKMANVSKSALLRFCQKLGYNGYSEFKYEISRYVASGIQESNTDENITSITSIYAASISSMDSFINENEIANLCDLIYNANKIKIFGIAETGFSAEYFESRLASLGVDAEVITYVNRYQEKIAFTKEGDLNIFLSLSSNTEGVNDTIQSSLENKASTALITQNQKALLRNKVDSFIVLPTLNIEKNKFFLDSQAIVLVFVAMVINQLARKLNEKV